MKKIVIALDYEKSAEKIARDGYELAKSMNASVILLHITSDPVYYSSLNYSPIFGFDAFSNLDILQQDVGQQIEKAAWDYLERVKKELGGGDKIQTVVRSGDFADSIMEIAGEFKADLIVMGSHSRTGLDNLFLGSVAKKVVQHSKIPMYIIPIKGEN